MTIRDYSFNLNKKAVITSRNVVKAVGFFIGHLFSSCNFNFTFKAIHRSSSQIPDHINGKSENVMFGYVLNICPKHSRLIQAQCCIIHVNPFMFYCLFDRRNSTYSPIGDHSRPWP